LYDRGSLARSAGKALSAVSGNVPIADIGVRFVPNRSWTTMGIRFDWTLRQAYCLRHLSGSPAGSPGPLEVIAAQPACDIDRLAYEIETGHGAHHHGAGIEFGCIHATQRDFCGAVPFRADGLEGPALHLFGCRHQLFVRQVTDHAGLVDQLAEQLRQALWQAFG